MPRHEVAVLDGGDLLGRPAAQEYHGSDVIALARSECDAQDRLSVEHRSPLSREGLSALR